MTAKQTREVNKLPVCYMSAFCETDGLWTSLSMGVPLHWYKSPKTYTNKRFSVYLW